MCNCKVRSMLQLILKSTSHQFGVFCVTFLLEEKIHLLKQVCLLLNNNINKSWNLFMSLITTSGIHWNCYFTEIPSNIATWKSNVSWVETAVKNRRSVFLGFILDYISFQIHPIWHGVNKIYVEHDENDDPNATGRKLWK